MKNLLLLASLFAFAAPAAAQNPGSLTTYFNSDFGYGGVIFDVTPSTDLDVTAFDVNLSARGIVAVDVYYRVGTSFGFEEDPNGWVLVDTVSVNGRGTDNPSSVPLADSAIRMTAGQTYGVFLDLQNVTASNTMRYTNAPSTTYTNADLTLVTNCAKAAGGITSTTFTPREFNGTVYYNPANGSGPTLATQNFMAGQSATIEFRNGTPGAMAVVGYSLVGAGPTVTAYGDVMLSAPIQLTPFVMLDANGSADFTQFLPVSAAGLDVWLQGVDLGGGLTTNALAAVIL